MNSDENYYEIRAVLSEYAGNHERELTAWVFGAVDLNIWDEVAPIRPFAEAMAWAYDPEGKYSQTEGTLLTFPHEEYGPVWQTIGDDDEWFEENMVGNTKLRNGHPVMERNIYGHMIIWHLMEEPTDEEWEALKGALNSYSDKVSIEKLSLNKVETIRTKLR